jgi:trans-2-enoyl-CoA reductase
MLNIYTVYSPNAKQCLSNTDASKVHFPLVLLLFRVSYEIGIKENSIESLIMLHSVVFMGRTAKWLNLDKKKRMDDEQTLRRERCK